MFVICSFKFTVIIDTMKQMATAIQLLDEASAQKEIEDWIFLKSWNIFAFMKQNKYFRTNLVLEPV